MRNRMLLLAALLLAVTFNVYAEQTQTPVTVAGLPDFVVTAQAQTAEVLATDTGTVGSKRAHVISMTTVDGYPVVLLVRIQKAPNGIFLDIIGEATIGELTTRVGSMEITGSSHPSTEEDAVDTAVLEAAAD